MADHCDALQIHAQLPVHPLSVPAVAAIYHKSNFLAAVGQLMHAHGIVFQDSSMLQSSVVLIATVLMAQVALLIESNNSNSIQFNCTQIKFEQG